MDFREGAGGFRERDRDFGVLSDEGPVSPEGEISGRPRFLRGLLCRGEEARDARGGAHESGSELGGCPGSASGLV